MYFQLGKEMTKPDSLDFLEERISKLEKIVGNFKDLEKSQVNFISF